VSQLTLRQLAKKIGVRESVVRIWIDEGLPHTGGKSRRRFEPTEVRDWLVENGKVAALPGKVLQKRSEVAQHFGVSVRTVADWLLVESFPGKVGAPGRGDGYFPVDEIATWWSSQSDSARAPVSDEYRSQLNRIRAEMAQLKLDQLRGKLVEVEAVERLLASSTSATRAILDALPDQVLAELPNDEEIKSRVTERVKRLLNDAYDQISMVYLELAEAADGSSD